MKAVAQRFELYLVYHFVDERELEEQLCLLLADAALTHVEQSCIVELTHGRSMRALHVVGVYLEHRLRVHSCCLCGAKVLVHLLRHGVLCAMAYKHSACEGSRRLVVEHIFVELVTRAVRHLVIYQRVVVHVLRLVGYHTAVTPALCAFALKLHVEAVARHAVVQRDDVMIKSRVALLLHVHVRDACVLVVGLLHAVEVERCVCSDVSLNHLRSEELLVVGGVVAEEELGVGALLHHDEHAAVHHHSHVRAQDVYHLHGFVHHDVALHVHEQSVLRQHSVECGDAVLVALRQACVVLSHELGVCLRIFGKRCHLDAFGKVLLGLQRLAELVVDDEVERRAEVGYIAAERLVRVDRHFKTVDVQSVVGLEELVYRCVFVSLHLSRREAETLEAVEGFVAHSVQHVGAVGVDLLTTFAVEVDVLLF